jgi:hypothetical protein
VKTKRHPKLKLKTKRHTNRCTSPSEDKAEPLDSCVIRAQVCAGHVRAPMCTCVYALCTCVYAMPTYTAHIPTRHTRTFTRVHEHTLGSRHAFQFQRYRCLRATRATRATRPVSASCRLSMCVWVCGCVGVWVCVWVWVWVCVCVWVQPLNN